MDSNDEMIVVTKRQNSSKIIEFTERSHELSDIVRRMSSGSFVAPHASSKFALELENYHKVAGEVLLSILGSSEEGLTEAVARQLLLKNGRNIVMPTKELPWSIKFILSFMKGFSPLLWVASFFVFLSWQPFGTPPGNVYNLALAIVLLVVIFVSGIFAFSQELQTSIVLSSFKSLLPPRCVVMRDGNAKLVSPTELVVGDVVQLQIGMRVPADLRMLTSQGLRLDNSVLTGETEPVKVTSQPAAGNTSLLQARNVAFMGSSVVGGAGTGLVFASGPHTQLSKIVVQVSGVEIKTSTLQLDINRFVVIISSCALTTASVVVLVWVVYLRVSHPGFMSVSGLITNAVSVVVAFIPEGLPLALSMGLTIIAKRLCQRHFVLVKQLSSIETLGSMALLASDKTGTLTQNKMTVMSFVTPDGIFPASCPALGGRAEVSRLENQGEGVGGGGGRDTTSKTLTPRLLFSILLIAILCNQAKVRGEAEAEGAGDLIEGDVECSAIQQQQRLPNDEVDVRRGEERKEGEEGSVRGAGMAVGQKLLALFLAPARRVCVCIGCGDEKDNIESAIAANNQEGQEPEQRGQSPAKSPSQFPSQSQHWKQGERVVGGNGIDKALLQWALLSISDLAPGAGEEERGGATSPSSQRVPPRSWVPFSPEQRVLALTQAYAVAATLPFSSNTKLSATVVIPSPPPLRPTPSLHPSPPPPFTASFWEGQGQGDGMAWVLVKGAPEYVLARCSHYIPLGGETSGEGAALTDQARAAVMAGVEATAGRGERVVALAFLRVPCPHPGDPGPLFHIEPEPNFPLEGLVFVACASVCDPPREGVAEAVAALRGACVRVAMVTGDAPTTAAAIAGQVGILSPSPSPSPLIYRVPSRFSDWLAQHDAHCGAACCEARASPSLAQDGGSGDGVGAKQSLPSDHTDEEKKGAEGDPPACESASSPAWSPALLARGVQGAEGVQVGNTMGEGEGKPANLALGPRSPASASASILVEGKDLSRVCPLGWGHILGHSEMIFARTSPEDKLLIVRAAQKSQLVVGVTGDGVNDSPALKRADIGIAMQAGSDVAKDAAGMVLLNNDFTSLVQGVQEGRLIFANLRKVIAYQMSAGSWAELMPVLATFFLGIPQPLSPLLMIVISCLTDVYAGVALTREGCESDALLRPPRDVRLQPLVDAKIIAYAFLFYGTMELVGAFTLYFLFMAERGPIINHGQPFPPTPEGSGGLDGAVFPAGYGRRQLIGAWGWGLGAGALAEDQLAASREASSVFFVALAVAQWGHLVSVRRRSPYLGQTVTRAWTRAWGLRGGQLQLAHADHNTRGGDFMPSLLPLPVVAAILMSATTVNVLNEVPFLQQFLGTGHVSGRFWGLSLAFSLLWFSVAEIRKWVIFLWPNSIVSKCLFDW